MTVAIRKPTSFHDPRSGRMLVTPVTEEYDHARNFKLLTNYQTHALEQRQAGRGETSVAI
jgi:hypothetical protein